MSDIRIKYLQFVERKPLLFSTWATTILCTASIVGLIVEMGKVCQPDLRLWLVVVIIRSIVRLLCRLYVAHMMTDAMILRGDIHGSSKFVDILDVFGIVWFAVGNLLVFNNFECIDVSPIVFFSSLTYIVLSYVSFFIPSILRCTFGICRPTAEADLAYLRQVADADREIAMIVRNNHAHQLEPDRHYSPDLTPERAQYWSVWLETYGCFAVNYHPTMDLKGKDREKTVSAPPSNASEVENPGNSDLEAGCDKPHPQQREYAYIPTINEGDGGNGEQGGKEKEEEEDFCSVCLLPFEQAPSSGQSTEPRPGAGEGEIEENNSIIVRYPCRGHHYFHAHCLHSWLQVSSARYLNSRRVPRGLESSHEVQVTCPCCREHPHTVDDIEAPRSSNMENNTNNNNSISGGARNGSYEQVPTSNNNLFAVALLPG